MEIFNTDKFINEIERRPGLYDKMLPEYSEKRAKEKLWIEVFEIMIEKWKELGKDDKITKGKELQRKWKNIRDNFRKEVSRQKKEKSGTGGKKRRKYIYFNQLMFLLPIIENELTSNNHTSLHLEDNVITKDFESIIDSLDNNVEKKEKSDRRQTVYLAKKKKPNYVETLSEIVQKKQTEEFDEDRLFLLSLLPSFKRMTEEEKLNLKIDFLNLIRQVTINRAAVTSTLSNCTSSSLTSMSSDSYEH